MEILVIWLLRLIIATVALGLLSSLFAVGMAVYDRFANREERAREEAERKEFQERVRNSIAEGRKSQQHMRSRRTNGRIV